MRKVIIMGAGDATSTTSTSSSVTTRLRSGRVHRNADPGIDDRTYPASLAGPRYPARHPDRRRRSWSS